MAVLAAMTGNIALLMVIVICAFFIVATRRGELTRYQGFGLRTAATTTNDQAWDAAHEAAIPALRLVIKIAAVAMIPSVVAGVMLSRFFPLGAETVSLVLLFAAYAITGRYLYKAVRVADTTARNVLDPEASHEVAAADGVAETAESAVAQDDGSASGAARALA